MRFYFDLTNGHSLLRDELGVEAPSLDEACRQARSAIREMLDANDLNGEGIGWTILVRDAKGVIRRTIEVGPPPDDRGP